MRIPSSIIQKPDAATVRNERAGKTDSSKSAGSDGSAQKVSDDDVRVSVSSEARRLADSAAVDLEKVERLRSAIESGTFEMNFQVIADRIVDTGG